LLGAAALAPTLLLRDPAMRAGVVAALVAVQLTAVIAFARLRR
jgi:hypothetical protein